MEVLNGVSLKHAGSVDIESVQGYGHGGERKLAFPTIMDAYDFLDLCLHSLVIFFRLKKKKKFHNLSFGRPSLFGLQPSVSNRIVARCHGVETVIHAK